MLTTPTIPVANIPPNIAGIEGEAMARSIRPVVDAAAGTSTELSYKLLKGCS